jgi:hypothetical protein
MSDSSEVTDLYMSCKNSFETTINRNLEKLSMLSNISDHTSSGKLESCSPSIGENTSKRKENDTCVCDFGYESDDYFIAYLKV